MGDDLIRGNFSTSHAQDAVAVLPVKVHIEAGELVVQAKRQLLGNSSAAYVGAENLDGYTFTSFHLPFLK